MTESTEAAFAVLTQFQEFVATLKGLRQQLVNDGWTDEQAREVLLTMFRQQPSGGAS